MLTDMTQFMNDYVVTKSFREKRQSVIKAQIPTSSTASPACLLFPYRNRTVRYAVYLTPVGKASMDIRS